MEISPELISENIAEDFQKFCFENWKDDQMLLICDNRKKLPDVFNSFHFTDDYWRATHEIDFTKFISFYLKITIGSYKIDKLPEKFKFSKRNILCAEHRVEYLRKSLLSSKFESSIKSDPENYTNYLKPLKATSA